MIATAHPPLEDVRRANVERRWPRHQWDASGRSRWAGWDWRNYLYLVICGLLLSGTVLESAISSDGIKTPWWPFGLLAESPAGRAVLIFLIVANGWLMDRHLADRTPGEKLVPLWLRSLRAALVSIPVLGLYAIPAWRWIVQTRPPWACRASALPRLRLSTASESITVSLPRLDAWSRALRRRQGQSFPTLFLWMIGGQIAPWIALLSWATTAATLSPFHQRALVSLDVSCHLLACALGLRFGVIRGRQTRVAGWRAVAIRLAPLFFLLPFPFWVPGILLWMIWAGEDVETFVEESYSNKGRPPVPIPLAKGSSLGRLRRSLAQGQREFDGMVNGLLPGALQNSQVENQRLAFYRLKTFALLLDAAALAWLLARLGGPVLRFDSPTLYLAPFLVLAGLGVIVELSFLALRVAGWLLRRAMPYQPYGRSLTFTQLALAAGLLFGACLAAGQASNAGLLLIAVGIGTAVCAALLFAPISFLLMLPGRQAFVTLAWAVLFFELYTAGAVMRSQPELAPPFLHLFNVAIALTPLWSLALFLGLRGWLLHPFKLGHLVDHRLPGGARAVLAAVILTAAAPLGGIAVPFWIYVHHRLWPRYEKLLWDLKKTGTVRL
ncbi:MAG TPA: hypothetical protein VGM86_11970 [Thermoanaerobaculia bacterium]|jgi:hypothetical protein